MKKIRHQITALVFIYSLWNLSINVQAQVCFGPYTNFGLSGIAVVSTDFNNDSKLDLASTGGGSTVVITLGAGDGTFGTGSVFSTGISFGYSMVIGDFNADGKKDLAIANADSPGSISILLGNGSGGFGTGTIFSVGNGPEAIITADFNGDGKVDLATSNFSSGNVSVLLGNGAGSFGAATNFSVGSNPKGLTSGDFNADSKIDLAVANKNSNNVSVRLGDGLGGFGAVTNFAVGNGPQAIISNDFNGDGKLDLVTGNYFPNNLSIILGNGTGGFGAATTIGVSGGDFTSLALADFNSDTFLDLVAAGTGNANITTVLSNGAGGFGAQYQFIVGGTGSSRIVTSADFNGDNKPDLAVGNGTGTGNTNISVLLGASAPIVGVNATNTTVCAGTPTTLTGTGATTYNWMPGSLSGTSVMVTPSTSTTYTVTGYTANGCGNTASVLINVNTAPAQPGTITGNVAVCNTSANSYSISSVSGATSYTWTLPGGWTGTSTTTTINTTASATSGNVSVTANKTGCSSAAQILAIAASSAIPAQPGIISGNSVLCSGSSNTYTIATVGGATSYTWTLPSGWTGSSTTNSITAVANSSGTSISVTANNACGSSTPQTLSLTVNSVPAQPGNINGNVIGCTAVSTTYDITAVSGATSYIWTLPSGWTGTSTTNSIAVTPGSANGTISVTASNSCGPSVVRNLSVTAGSIPTQPISIIGNSTICLPANPTFSIATVSGATSYTWTLPSGWTGTSTTNSISPTQVGSTGAISVTANNGCGSSIAQTLNVTISSLLNQPGAISGSAVACSTISSTYNVAAVAGATSYVWTLPSGWSGASTTNSIAATPNLNGGTISVTANNACGLSTATTMAVTVSTLPFAVLTSPSAAICEGQNATFGIIATGLSLTYQWQENKGTAFVNVANGGVYAGATAANLVLTGITATMNSYKYQCIVTNFCGVETSSSATLTVAPLPAKPTITVSFTNPEAPVLTSSGANIYQWFKDGTAFGGNTQTITATIAGIYTVKTTNNGCTSILSDPQVLIVTGDIASASNATMSLYPNPSTDYITLSLDGFEKDKPVYISIVDMLGKTLEKTTGLGQHEVTIDIRSYALGKYVVGLQQYNTRVSQQFMKSEK
jgi:hypothetical protein